MDRERKWGSPPAPPTVQPTLQGGGGHHLPRPTAKLVPHHAKGASSNGETAAQGNPPRQRQRWERQRQSPHHPRLWENHKRSLIGGPRKTGGPGWRQHGERGRRAEVRPVAPPGASLASFWASRKKLAAAAAKLPDPAPQAPTHRALMRWTAKEDGISLPRLLRRSQRSRVVEVTTPSTTEELVPHHAKGALSNGGTTIMEKPPRQRQR